MLKHKQTHIRTQKHIILIYIRVCVVVYVHKGTQKRWMKEFDLDLAVGRLILIHGNDGGAGDSEVVIVRLEAAQLNPIIGVCGAWRYGVWVAWRVVEVRPSLRSCVRVRLSLPCGSVRLYPRVRLSLPTCASDGGWVS
jgi:hypothetical protein